MKTLVSIHKGGKGSGHWGHAGRPGEVGGSVSGSVAMSRTSGPSAIRRRAIKLHRDELTKYPNREVPKYFNDSEYGEASGILLRGTNENIEPNAFVAKAYGNFEYGGLHTSRVTAEVERGYIKVEGEFRTKDDKYAGGFTREIHETGTVDHYYMRVMEGHTGSGFGSAFYQHTEEVYMAAGIQRIELFANLDVGGYAWARMGFEFQSYDKSRHYTEKLFSMWKIHTGTKHPLDGVTVTMSAWEIAASVTPDGNKIGKSVLLGNNWDAYKSLKEGSEGVAIGNMYYDAKAKKKKQKEFIEEKGGPGSGHYGHSGRPGKVGGSVSGSIAMSVRTGRTAKKRQQLNKIKGNITSGNFSKSDIGHNPGVTPSAIIEIKNDGKAIAKAHDDMMGEFDTISAEVDTYELAKKLGWDDMVPYTTSVTLVDDILSVKDGFGNKREVGEGDRVSIQLWVENSEMLNRAVLRQDEVDRRSFGRLHLLDVITGNPDRHDGNVIIGENNNFIAIDNNRSFAPWYDSQYKNYGEVFQNAMHRWESLGRANLWTGEFSSTIPVSKADFEAVESLFSESGGFVNMIENKYGLNAAIKMMDRFSQLKHNINSGNLYTLLE